MKGIRLLAATLVLPLAACAGGDQTAGQNSMEGDPGAAGPAGAAAEGGHAMGTSVALAPRNQSGMSGTAVLRPAGDDSLVVELNLSGLKAGESYPAHVHQGSCQSPGTVVTGLTNVAADSAAGSSTTRVSDPRASGSASSYLIMAHLPDGTPGLCGEIPTEKEPPAAGSGGGDSGAGGGAGASGSSSGSGAAAAPGRS